MDRVLRNTAATISATFSIDETATDPSPDTATVTITRADGTALVTGASATNAGVGVFSYTLTPSQTALLERFTARWTATLSGSVQTLETVVEVAGGFLFSKPYARQDPDLADTTKYSSERLTTARTMAETALEHACRQAFVPRYEYESVADTGGTHLGLKWPKVRAVRSVSSGGTAINLADVSLLGGAVRWAYPTLYGYNADVAVGYEHGLDFPPGICPRVALRLAKHYMVESPLDDRALRIDLENGSWAVSTPGMGGQHFGIPEVDAFVADYGIRRPSIVSVAIS